MMKRENGLHREPVLVGNTFPLSLVRRRVLIEPAPLSVLKCRIRERGLASFWGHPETLAAARAILGAEVTPSREREPLMLDPDRLPVLGGRTYRECWVLSPDYPSGYRPPAGKAADAGKIRGWRVLRLTWTD